VNEAKEMMANSGMKLISRDNLDEAARLAAKMSNIIGVAKEAGLNVSFDI
jgi:succinyl-CoA synthetase beta subunit